MGKQILTIMSIVIPLSIMFGINIREYTNIPKEKVIDNLTSQNILLLEFYQRHKSGVQYNCISGASYVPDNLSDYPTKNLIEEIDMLIGVNNSGN